MDPVKPDFDICRKCKRLKSEYQEQWIDGYRLVSLVKYCDEYLGDGFGPDRWYLTTITGRVGEIPDDCEYVLEHMVAQ